MNLFIFWLHRIHNDDPNAQRLPEVHGALVSRIIPNSPAAMSGFRKNDIIVAVNGDDVSNSEDADMRLDKCKPGSFTRVRIVRGEPSVTIELQSSPLDLLPIIIERKMREQLITSTIFYCLVLVLVPVVVEVSYLLSIVLSFFFLLLLVINLMD